MNYPDLQAKDVGGPRSRNLAQTWENLARTGGRLWSTDDPRREMRLMTPMMVTSSVVDGEQGKRRILPHDALMHALWSQAEWEELHQAARLRGGEDVEQEARLDLFLDLSSSGGVQEDEIETRQTLLEWNAAASRDGLPRGPNNEPGACFDPEVDTAFLNNAVRVFRPGVAAKSVCFLSITTPVWRIKRQLLAQMQQRSEDDFHLHKLTDEAMRTRFRIIRQTPMIPLGEVLDHDEPLSKAFPSDDTRRFEDLLNGHEMLSVLFEN
ncbi:unnamed protein product [Amoebophrya sp. A25]|nr:unnamed protein product [Amoebophrya sp. A25]|eukprot:GSA25T00019354001.1